MSDGELRALQQRWLATRAREDEARYLAARLRAGELSRGRLELAAWLGHWPARTVLGDAAPVLRLEAEGVARELGADGRAALRRAVAAVLAARPALAEPRAQRGAAALRAHDPADPAGDEALRAAAEEVVDLKEERILAGDFEGAAGARELQDALRRARDIGADDQHWLLLLRDIRGSSTTAGDDGVLTWALGPSHRLDPDERDPVDVETARLEARVQAGALIRARLELAAHAGHPAAAQATGVPPGGATLVEWLEGLARWGPDAVVRAALDVLERAWLLDVSAPGAFRRALRACVDETCSGDELTALLHAAAGGHATEEITAQRLPRLLAAMRTSDAAALLALVRDLDPGRHPELLDHVRSRTLRRALRAS